jgi:integrase
MTRPPKPRPEISGETRRAIELEIATRNPTLALAVAILWYTGLRVTELTRLRWEDVENFFTPRPLLSIPAEITKTNTPRIIPVPMPLHRRLETAAAEDPDQMPMFRPTGFLIHHRLKTEPMSPRSIQYALGDTTAALKLPHLTPHSFRHSFATRLLRVSNIRITQLALGHKSITSTAIYTHPTLDEIEIAMTRAALEEA